MLDLAPVEQRACVVELGAGTGPITGEVLRRLGTRRAGCSPSRWIPCSPRALAERFPDPRLQVITDSAERLEEHLDGRRPEVIVSALPFTSLPGDVGKRILQLARRVLADDGRMVVLQYSLFLQRDLRRIFGSVERHVSPLNVPPAMLFLCRPGGARAA
jgi:phospholipid N-methyltransferase